MRNLLGFLIKYCHWFLFVVIEILCLVLLFRFNSYQGSVWFTSANAVAGKVYEWNSEVMSFLNLTQLNQQLTTRNLMLEQRSRIMSEQIEKLKGETDSTFVAGLDTAGITLRPARVVGNSVHKHDNLITIDKGRADGIREDMGVACGMGVVGIVYLVSDHYSVVIPVLNSHSSISVAIRNRNYFGYLRWDGKASNEAYVDDIPRHARFKKGDTVVTSGYSFVFPPGIAVGKITNIYNSSDGMSYMLKIKLFTDFARLRDVCVIKDESMSEKMQLLHSAKDSIKVMGK